MTNLRSYEIYVDECNGIFMDAMCDLEGQSVDLSKWLQWYAFDVIASITFQQRFGFMEQRQDVDNMIRDLDLGVGYIKFISQYPGVHPYLIGNRSLMKFLERCFGELPDALSRFMKVPVPLYPDLHRQITEICLDHGGRDSEVQERR